MAMDLEMDGIIECGVINLVMWVAALSLKGSVGNIDRHFQKEKLLYLLPIVWVVFFYVFPSTNIVLVFTSKLCGRRTTHTGHTGLFFFYVFSTTTFVHSFDCFVCSVIEKVCFLESK